MKLNTIQKEGLWSNISDRINENFNKVDSAVESLKSATVKNCGYYSTVAALREAYSTASAGAKAYVGDNFPYAIYLWDSAINDWRDSGEVGGTEDVTMNNSITTIVNGDVTNNPDNEDLVAEDDKLKFANKAYNKAAFSGLGRIYLRKNMVGGTNLLTQDMLSAENTVYHIQYDYDLEGKEITMPANCVLQFDGGSFKNGSVIFSNTTIQGVRCLDVRYSGIIANTTIKMIWFIGDFADALQDAINCAEASSLSVETSYGKIYGGSFQSIALESKKKYSISKTITFGLYLNLEGNNAIIEQTTTSDILVSDKGFNIYIKDVVFVGRDVTAVRIDNPNLDSSFIRFNNVGFITDNITNTDSNYALHIHAQSSQVTLDKCFVKSAPKFLYVSSDFCYINDCWVNGYSQYSSLARPDDTCCIENHSRLHISRSVFVPEVDGGVRSKNSRWIDNHAGVYIDNSHFGAENGGYSIVWQYRNFFGDTWDTNYISITNTQCAGGGTIKPHSGVVVLMNNIAPGHIVFRNNRFAKDTPCVSLYGYVQDMSGVNNMSPQNVYLEAAPIFKEYVESLVPQTNNENCMLVPSSIYIDDSMRMLDEALSVYAANDDKVITLSRNVDSGTFVVGDFFRTRSEDTGVFEKYIKVMLEGTFYQSPSLFAMSRLYRIVVINEYGNTPTVMVEEVDSHDFKVSEDINLANISIQVSCDIISWIRQELKIYINNPDQYITRLSLSYKVIDDVHAFRMNALGGTKDGGYFYFRPAVF